MKRKKETLSVRSSLVKKSCSRLASSWTAILENDINVQLAVNSSSFAEKAATCVLRTISLARNVNGILRAIIYGVAIFLHRSTVDLVRSNSPRRP